jgi:hypothetical protein
MMEFVVVYNSEKKIIRVTGGNLPACFLGLR